MNKDSVSFDKANEVPGQLNTFEQGQKMGLDNAFFKSTFVNFTNSGSIYYVDCAMKWNIGPIKMGQIVDVVVLSTSSVEFFTYNRTHGSYSCIYSCNLVKMQSSARKIQRVWRRCIADPNFVICKKRLLKEFESCVQ